MGGLSNLLSAITNMDGSGHPGFKVEVTLSILIEDPNAFPFHDHCEIVSDAISMSPRQDEMGMVHWGYFIFHLFPPFKLLLPWIVKL
jgi:hypothetical protein